MPENDNLKKQLILGAAIGVGMALATITIEVVRTATFIVANKAKSALNKSTPIS
jgi:hypothetical protein